MDFPPVPSPRADETWCLSTQPDCVRQETRTEVTTLDHEVLDDTVELRALVAEALREGRAILLDTSRESAEVLGSLGDGLFVRQVRTLPYERMY